MVVNSVMNEGTSCSFELNFVIDSTDNLVTKSQQVKEGAFKGVRVLLAEDNDMNRFIARQSLDYLGIKTTEAENGQVAIELLSKQDFDLVLMDIQMPIMDGLKPPRTSEK